MNTSIKLNKHCLLLMIKEMNGYYELVIYHNTEDKTNQQTNKNLWSIINMNDKNVNNCHIRKNAKYTMCSV